MGLNDIASSIDKTLEQASSIAEQRDAVIVEHSSAKMAHHIVAYVLERAEVGTDPFMLGQTMVQGAAIGEDEVGGFLADPVIQFLESLLEGAKDALTERVGSEHLTLDPVAHCVQYFIDHQSWPDEATPSTIARAKAVLAAGQRGRGKGAAFGTFI